MIYQEMFSSGNNSRDEGSLVVGAYTVRGTTDHVGKSYSIHLNRRHPTSIGLGWFLRIK